MLIYGRDRLLKIGGARDIAPDGKSLTAKSLDSFERGFQPFAGIQVEATDGSAGFREALGSSAEFWFDLLAATGLEAEVALPAPVTKANFPSRLKRFMMFRKTR